MGNDSESNTRSSFLKTLRDGALTFILGLALAALRLVPDEWINQQLKFYSTIVLIVAFFVVVSAMIFYNDFREYLSIRREIREYYQYAPKLLKFLDYKRIYQLDQHGNAEVTFALTFKNVSERPIQIIGFPTLFDLSQEKNARSCIEVMGATIGTQELLQYSERCYEKKGVLTLENGARKERGMFRIPLEDIGGLEPGKSTEVRIRFKAMGAYANLQNGESTVINIHRPTEKIRIVVCPPDEWKIMLNPSREFPKSIEVFDKASGIVDHKELEAVPMPELNENRITWVVKKPKIANSYKLNYKALKANSNP